jgi:TonB family protein
VRRHQPGREVEVESLYQRALAIEDPRSLDSVDTLANYAAFLRSMHRTDEAREMDARSLELRRSNPTGVSARILISPGFRVGNGVTAPKLLAKVEPEYSEAARRAKIAGTVLLFIVVEPDGHASNMRVVRSLEPSLDQKAMEAVARWRFQPGAKDGMPVPVQATIEVNFRLL